MPTRYKPYPEYKDSGVDWLGKLPKHWEIKRVGQCFKERRQKVSDKDYPPLSVTMQGIVPQLETAAKSDDGDNRKLVLKNDFVINSRSDRKGSSGTSPLDGSVSLISIVLEPREILPAFVHHLFRSYPFQEEFYRYGKGIVADLWSTNFSEMKNILIPGIPAQEQIQIANFLDHETGKIDALIEKQQQLIKLLQEKRQAVISHAVTKGLNPAAPMKDSGIDWLGQVPSDWQVCRLKYVTSFITSGPRGWSDYLSDSGKEIFLQSGDLNDNLGIELDHAKRIDSPGNSEGVRTKLEKGDVVICITGANTGRVAIIPELRETVYINQHLSLIRPFRRVIDSLYLSLFLSSNFVKSHLAITQYGLKEGLSLANIAEIPICVPTISDQLRLGEFVDRFYSRIGKLMDRAFRQIELLQERRTALISAAVTGKIDVRDWRASAGSTVYSVQKAQNTRCETEMEMLVNGEEVADD